MSTAIWQPTHPETSQLWQFMRWLETKYAQVFANYQDLHTWSVEQPALFWQSLCEFYDIDFSQKPAQTLKLGATLLDAQWFPGATFNIAQKLLSRQDNKLALICINEASQRETLSYAQLYQQVAHVAAGLKSSGVKSGDRVVAVMPNIAATVIALLATASLGAIWSACSPDFGAKAIIDRFQPIEPSILLISDGHQYAGKHHLANDKINQIAKELPSLKKIIIYSNTNNKIDIKTIPKSVYWQDFLIAEDTLNFTQLPFEHPLYILFSSGTTGRPKCIIHSAGGTFIQHIKELGLHTNLAAQDNLLFYTTCGWMMWNWMISALALGTTLILYEGSPTWPDANCLFKLIEQEKVTVFGTSAKFISSIEKSELKPNKHFKLKNLRTILSTGSPLLPANYTFVYQYIKPDVQLSSISGGTDIISCFALGNPLTPVYPGEIQCIGLGMDVDIFNEQGQSLREQRGELVCKHAFPSMPIGFWNDSNKQRYQQTYFTKFPGIWTHGDFAEITANHGVIICGRSDTVLNPGGVRIGSAEIYRQIEDIPEIMDSIVIGQQWHGEERMVLFVKLQPKIQLNDELQQKIRNHIRQNTSPRHVPAKILQVSDIPKTMNGKIVEVAVREVVNGQTVSCLDSIANPEILSDFKNRPELM